MGLARTAQPSLRWAEISDLVRNIFPTCRKYVLREQWEQLYLPLRPLCTNDFIEGVYRQPRAKALEGYRYIEANPKTVSDLLNEIRQRTDRLTGQREAEQRQIDPWSAQPPQRRGHGR